MMEAALPRLNPQPARGQSEYVTPPSGRSGFGKVIDYLATVVVNAGFGVFTNRIIQAGTAPKNIGWGTGAGTAAAGDTTLFTEALVDLTAGGTDHTVGTESRTTTTQTNDTYTVIGTRTATGAGTVTNAGLFDAASGGTLTVKGDFTGIGLASGDSIAFTFNVKLA
jgi:hypothetical protein